MKILVSRALAPVIAALLLTNGATGAAPVLQDPTLIVLSDLIWEDVNGNGLQDLDEPGVPGVIVRAFACGSTNELASARSDIQGGYELRMVRFPGRYYVRFDLPAGFRFAPRDRGPDDTLDSDAYDDGTTDCVLTDSYVNRLDAGLVRIVQRPPCPRNQRHWKSKTEVWPVTSLVLGRRSYKQSELLDLLQMPVKGDASILLAQQLIAAKLNLANGSEASRIAATVAQADRLLGKYPGKLPYKIGPASPDRPAVLRAASELDLYNRGLLTSGCEPCHSCEKGKNHSAHSASSLLR